MKIHAYLEYRGSGIEADPGVPEHWEVRRMRFCVQVGPRSRRQSSLRPEDEVSFIPMEAVGEYGGLDLGLSRSIEEIGKGYTAFDDGDVVLAKITPCFENGRGAIANGLLNGMAFGTTELHVLRASPLVDNRFLFYVTISHAFRSHGEGAMYGAGGQKRVPTDFCKDFRLLLTDIGEQRGIADF